LIEPLQGYFLEEGPAENMSSDHYGWWATGNRNSDDYNYGGGVVARTSGPPEPTTELVTDPQNYMGIIRLTKTFDFETAEVLANLIYDRIHNEVEPDPFETWDEFRLFLQHENASTILLESGFGVLENKGLPRNLPYNNTHTHPDDRRAIAEQMVADQGLPNEFPFIRKQLRKLNRMDGYEDVGIGVGAIYDDNYSQQSRDPNLIWNTDDVVDWWNNYYVQKQQDLLMANFNPNSLFNDWNPNKNIYLAVDKSQLVRYTTEFCFEPTGVFAIESRGEVYDNNGKVHSNYTVKTVVKIFEIFRQTSQAQFMKGIGINPLDDYFSMTAEKTHELWDKNYTLQSYPEPLIANYESYLQQCRYDGFLMPATLQSTRHFPLKFYGSFNEGLVLNWSKSQSQVPSWKNILTDKNWANSSSLLNADGVLYPDGAYSEKNRVLAYRMALLTNGPSNREKEGRMGTIYFWIKPNFHTGISTRIRKILAGPSQKGWSANQVLPVLYYFANASSNEESGGDEIADSSRKYDRIYFQDYTPSAYGAQYSNYWTPTRCLAFGFAWSDIGDDLLTLGKTAGDYFYHGQVFSCSAAHDYPLHNENVSCLGKHYFQGHQWNHIAVSWDIAIGHHLAELMRSTFVNLLVNGRVVHEERSGIIKKGAPAKDQYPITTDFIDIPTNNLGYLRFGELSPQDKQQTEFSSSYYADSTFDEICAYDRTRALDSVHFPDRPYDLRNIAQLWPMGRYLSKTVDDGNGVFNTLGCYTSPNIDLQGELRLPGRSLILRSVSWTLYWPFNNRAVIENQDIYDQPVSNIMGIPINDSDPRDPLGTYWGEDENWDPISIDFQTAEGNWFFEDHVGLEKRFTYAGGSTFNGNPIKAIFNPGKYFRYKVYFHISPGSPALWEAPVFDDITFTFTLPRPHLLSWCSVG